MNTFGKKRYAKRQTPSEKLNAEFGNPCYPIRKYKGMWHLNTLPGWKVYARPFCHLRPTTFMTAYTLAEARMYIKTAHFCYCADCRLRVTKAVLDGQDMPYLAEWQAGLP